MKVVHLNTYDGNGGAGRAVLRLHKGLRLLGVDSEVVCLYQFNSQSGVQAISQTLFGKFRSIINILFERFLIKPFLKSSAIPFSLQRLGISVNSLKTIQQADLIHLHWLNHGFLSAKEIAELAKLNKKIVFTTHDSNPVTGGCHVRYHCTNYQQECGHCPVLKNPSANDLSHRTWQLKKQAYQQVDFDFIAPSTWMGEQVAAASLASGKKVHTISNGIETDIFHPLDRSASRKAYGIDENAIVILAGYMPSKSDRHKGFPELMQTIKNIAADTEVAKENLLLLFFGSTGENSDVEIPIKHRFLGQINQDEELAKLYSLADVFLFPSLEESMGYTALESIACGTPVVAFNTSGVTDVVVHQQNGFLAQLYDTQGLADGLKWVIQNKNKSTLRASAREWAVANFSLDLIAQKHLHLYQSLLHSSHV